MANYPLIVAHTADKRIIAAYQDMVISLGADAAAAALDIVNGKSSDRIVVDAQADLGDYRFIVRDARGREVDAGAVTLSVGPHAFRVPPAGLLSLQR